MSQLGFCFDMRGCIGCKTCQVACKDKNDLPPGLLFRRVTGYEGGEFPKPWVYYLSLGCNHCAAPACAASCPAGALYKEAGTGAVLVEEAKCTGCQQCRQACPYDVPRHRQDTGKVAKCDMCRDLLAAGEEPACVSSCVMRVLRFGPLSELRRSYDGTRDVRGLPASSGTNPSILIIPSPEAVNADSP